MSLKSFLAVDDSHRSAGKSLILTSLRAFVNKGNFYQKDCREDFFLAIDWNVFLAFAHRQRILPFVALSLQAAKMLNKFPIGVSTQLEESLKRAMAENLWKNAEFQRFNRILDERGIPVIPLKGIALTHQIYQQQPVRQMRDIDLLIRRNDLQGIENLLQEQGFEVGEGLHRWQMKLTNRMIGRSNYIKDGLDLDFQRSPRFLIGNHWVEWDVRGAWKKAFPCASLGHNVFMLPPLQQAQYLLFQIANDFEASTPRLVQLLDLAVVIKRYDLQPEIILNSYQADLNFQSQQRLSHLLQAVNECFLEGRNCAKLSPTTREIVEYFFQDPASHRSFAGKPFLKSNTSALKKLVFLLGYFLPSKIYLRQKCRPWPFGFLAGYLGYWWDLFRKTLKLLRSEVTSS